MSITSAMTFFSVACFHARVVERCDARPREHADIFSSCASIAMRECDFAKRWAGLAGRLSTLDRGENGRVELERGGDQAESR